MKELNKIPSTKIARTSKFISAGVKVGGNYIKHYAKKSLGRDISKDTLDEANARDLFKALSELKGSALKAAQMISMDYGILPKAYADQFQLTQSSTPPLSYPLVVKTFKKSFQKRPHELFDTFSRRAINAASIGQVHRATIQEKAFAVKVQYPGVADSVSTDLKIAKPLASRLANISMEEINYYMDEIEGKLIEETDYKLELKRSIHLSDLCSQLENVVFPTYYPEFSSDRIITMDWMDGVLLKEWIESEPSQTDRNIVGQAIWDFYQYQIHHLKMAHADPHPGNFIITEDNKVAVIDFGCVKEIPEQFYDMFIQLMSKETRSDKKKLYEIYHKMNMIHPEDSDEEIDIFVSIYDELIDLLAMPFDQPTFDFSDEQFFKNIYGIINDVLRNKRIWRAKAARGSRDGIYINRIYFGLYSMMHDIGAKIYTDKFN